MQLDGSVQALKAWVKCPDAWHMATFHVVHVSKEQGRAYSCICLLGHGAFLLEVPATSLQGVVTLSGLQVVLGMPHRGRLNVLCTLLGKPAGELFQEMDNAQSRFHVGDVKYHLGQSSLLSFPHQACPHRHAPVLVGGVQPLYCCCCAAPLGQPQVALSQVVPAACFLADLAGPDA